MRLQCITLLSPAYFHITNIPLMKNFCLTLLCTLIFSVAHAQGTVCNPSGNLVIFSNYDGGVLNINVDMNIPNLKIGIVSYEADSINLSGAYLNNVTGVVWAGYNGTNHHCAFPVITNTTIVGAPGTATTAINILPLSPINNPNGYQYIVCNYSCSNNTSQGGCNTSDQIEAYFLQQFPGSVIYSDFTQYGCWSGTKNISAGGNCCGTVVPFSATANAQNETCFGSCNGSATASANGGQTPYTYLWNTGATTATINNLCNGNYSVTVYDAGAGSSTQTVTVNAAPDISSSQNLSGCEGYSVTVGTNSYTQSGTYSDTLTAANSCDSVVTTVLNIISYPVITTAPASVTVNNGADALFFVSTTTVGATFQWQVNDGSGFADVINGNPYSGATNDSLIISPADTSMDNYSYRCIISSGACADTTALVKLTVLVPSFVSEINENAILIYPNPANEQLIIDNGQFKIISIDIIDMLGRTIHAEQTNSQLSIINCQMFSPGIYFVNVKLQSGEIVVKKFVKE